MKSQELMDLYSDFLTSSPNVASATLLSDLLNQAYSHDSFTRMLAQPELDQKQYWKVIKKSVRQIGSDEGVISFDDTIEHKPHSDENELISWHFDHSSGKSVKGINFVTYTYVSDYGGVKVKLPIAWDLVRKDKWVEKVEKKGGKFVHRQVRQASISKIDLVKDRLEVLVNQNHIPCRYFVFDTWYSSAALMIHIVKQLKKHFVCAIKENRLIRFDEDKSGKAIHWVQVSQASLEPQKPYRVRLKDVPFGLCLVKKVYQNLDGSSGVQYLLSSDTNQDEKQIDQTYQKRWSSEDLHRSLKQNTALEKMPAKKECSQANHIFASMVAQVKLEALKIATQKNHYALKRQILLQALKNAWKQIQELKEFALDKKVVLPNFKPA